MLEFCLITYFFLSDDFIINLRNNRAGCGWHFSLDIKIKAFGETFLAICSLSWVCVIKHFVCVHGQLCKPWQLCSWQFWCQNNLSIECLRANETFLSHNIDLSSTHSFLMPISPVVETWPVYLFVPVRSVSITVSGCSLKPFSIIYIHRDMLWCRRYAIGNAERPLLPSKVGWLDILANDTHQFYGVNNTGGPSIKVCPPPPPPESLALNLNWTIYFGEHSLLGCDTV